MTSATCSHLVELLESLEKRRDALAEVSAEAGLQLTAARWVCEQRGYSCDWTAIPTQAGALKPLAQLHVALAPVGVSSAVETGNSKHEETITASAVVKDEYEDLSWTEFPFFELSLQPGYQPPPPGSSKKLRRDKPPQQSEKAKKVRSSSKTSEGTTTAGDRSHTTVTRSPPLEHTTNGPNDNLQNSNSDGLHELEERESGMKRDPVLWVSPAPPKELLRCRDHYRRVVEAVVHVANQQLRLLYWAAMRTALPPSNSDHDDAGADAVSSSLFTLEDFIEEELESSSDTEA